MRGIRIPIERHPFALGHRPRSQAFPHQFAVADTDPANIPEEQQRNWTPQPFLEVFFDFSLSALIGNPDRHSRPS